VDRGRARFAAHAPFYPVCWSALRRSHALFAAVTGAPVHIFAGEQDDYDEPDTCQKFLDSLGDEPRKAFALTVYPGATHGWDGQGRGVTSYDPNGALGKGAQVRLYPDAHVAARSRREAVAFFLRAFGARGD
jgi:dienelactone hydrolase